MNRIKEARIAAGLSQKYVATTLGVSGPSVSNWESGKTTPTTENLASLSALFCVSVDYLLGRDSDEDQPDQVSDRMKRFLHEVQDMDDSEIELVSMFLEQVKKRRE